VFDAQAGPESPQRLHLPRYDPEELVGRWASGDADDGHWGCGGGGKSAIFGGCRHRRRRRGGGRRSDIRFAGQVRKCEKLRVAAGMGGERVVGEEGRGVNQGAVV